MATVNDHMNVTQGMTLRDYFAGQAVAAIMSDPWYRSGEAKDQTWDDAAPGVAVDAYFIADAMLAERAKNR